MVNKQNPSPDWMHFSGTGIQFAATVALTTWLGSKVDFYLKSEPFGMLFGILFGIFAAMYHLYKDIQNIKKKM